MLIFRSVHVNDFPINLRLNGGVMLESFQVESDGHPQASRHSRHAEDAAAESTTFLATTASATATTAVGVPNFFFEKERFQKKTKKSGWWFNVFIHYVLSTSS